jgi:hypothetical protein
LTNTPNPDDYPNGKPITDPAQGIIDAGDGTFLLDVPTFITGLLMQEWDAAKTDGDLPVISLGDVFHRVDVCKSTVLVWGLDESSKPVTIGWHHTEEGLPFMLDFYAESSDDALIGRTAMVKLRAEARRIIEKHRRSTLNGYIDAPSLMVWQRATNLDKTTRGFHHHTADVRLTITFNPVRLDVFP